MHAPDKGHATAVCVDATGLSQRTDSPTHSRAEAAKRTRTPDAGMACRSRIGRQHRDVASDSTQPPHGPARKARYVWMVNVPLLRTR